MVTLHLTIAVFPFIASQILASTVLTKRNNYNEKNQCRCIPGDPCWPSIEKWRELNDTINGRLIATVPVGHPCHDPTYDEAACATLQEEWDDPKVHYTSSSSIMSPIFLNQSCDPFTPKERPCLIGNYVQYAIDVGKAEHVVAGLHFARTNNVRIVVKNTGHDYLGKSTAKGALSLWTHNLNSLSYIPTYSSATQTQTQKRNQSSYTGPAIKLGAGVQGFQAYTFADAHHSRILSGQCTTVGLAGGYTQGGGHSLLSSKYGLAADNVLEWEVITADGKIVVATPEGKNGNGDADLFWALSGGGGGTFGVVMSMTVKAWPDGQVSGAKLSVLANSTTDDTYWDMIGKWQSMLPEFITPADGERTGAHLIYNILRDSFTLSPLTLPDQSADDVRALLRPFITYLKEKRIPFEYTVTSNDTFMRHFTKYFGPLPDGIYTVAQVLGGRLVPKGVVTDETKNAKLTDAMREIVKDGTFYIGALGVDVSHAQGTNKDGNSTGGANAVNPAWRAAISDVLIVSDWNYSAPFDDMLDRQNTLTNEIMPKFKAVTPGSGTYSNEGDFQTSTWREDFYGKTYERLSQVKGRWDAEGIFYARTGVGSEEWREDGEGRLCRV